MTSSLRLLTEIIGPLLFLKQRHFCVPNSCSSFGTQMASWFSKANTQSANSTGGYCFNAGEARRAKDGVYLHRKATRGLSRSISSAARMKGMTSGATERGTCCPASGATPAGSLRDASVLASASRLRLAVAAAADDVDVPAVSITGSRTRDDDDGDY
jgi:hypothetical protein